MLLEPSPNHDHSNGASDRYSENSDTAVPDPKDLTIPAVTEDGVGTAAVASKSSLACVLNSRESGHRRVNHRNKRERSESSGIEQLKVGHRNKGESGYSRIQHLKRKTTA